jgi:hypothetical protein
VLEELASDINMIQTKIRVYFVCNLDSSSLGWQKLNGHAMLNQLSLRMAIFSTLANKVLHIMMSLNNID